MEKKRGIFPQHGKKFSTLWKTGVWVLICGAGFAAAGGEMWDGPFRTRNGIPVVRVQGIPPGGGDGGEGGRGLWTGMTLEVGNQSIAEIRENERLVLDGETWGASWFLGHRWGSGWAVEVELPFVAHRRGRLDGFLDGYHAALGLPRGNRRRRADRQLEYVFQRAGRTWVEVTEPVEGVGDVRVSMSAPLWRSAGRERGVMGVAGVELPTGDADRLLGSGSTDVHLGVSAFDREWLSRWKLGLRGSAGVVMMSGGGPLAEVRRAAAAYGSLGVDWAWTERLHPRVQVDWHSPLFEGVEAAALRRGSVGLGAGFRLRWPGGWGMDAVLVEDLVVDAAPDVVVHLAVWKGM